jgi:hypothetical protein
MAAARLPAARQVVVAARDHFPLADLEVVVLQAEGTVQLVYLAHGWEGGPLKPMANQFCGPGTAAQLRAIAGHLDCIDWAAPGGAA